MARPDHNIFPQGDWAGKTIGLLGGSFNPVHDTHVAITDAALKRLGLDAVWWLVSPQNPLKSAADMAPFDDRLNGARRRATDPRIYVTDLERQLGTRYSVDMLDRLVTRLPDSRFVWLMGADNLAQFSQWKDWKKIAHTVVFAIFDRPGYSAAIEMSTAAQYFRDSRIPEDRAAALGSMTAPAWTVIRDVYSPLSSTKIRRKNFNNQEVTLPNNHMSEDNTSSSLDPPGRNALQELILNSLEDDKAEEIIFIDLKGKSSIADSMVIASGHSTRQVAAIADHLVTRIKHAGHGLCKVEGLEKSDWVLIDAGDVIVHIFRPEVRSFYNLEKMWTMDIAPDDFTPDRMPGSVDIPD